MDTHVLVAFATKHGSTRGIADRISEELRAAGLTVSIAEVREVAHIEQFDAVVLGSALYAGRWRSEAVAFAKRHRGALSTRPLWLFSSGPLDTDTDRATLAMTGSVTRAIGGLRPIDHRTFGGALLPGTPGLVEALMARRLAGDYRDWDDVAAWSREIAAELARRGQAEAPVAAAAT